MSLNGPISNSKAPRSSQKTKDVESPYLVKKSKRRPLKCEFSVSHCENETVFVLPIRLPSEANNFDNWRTKHTRHKRQKELVDLAFKKVECQITLPCTCVLVRYGSRFLDEEDNLRYSFKWIKDAIAANLTQDFVPGRADSDKRITWQYEQVKSKEYQVKIIIKF